MPKLDNTEHRLRFEAEMRRLGFNLVIDPETDYHGLAVVRWKHLQTGRWLPDVGELPRNQGLGLGHEVRKAQLAIARKFIRSL